MARYAAIGKEYTVGDEQAFELSRFNREHQCRSLRGTLVRGINKLWTNTFRIRGAFEINTGDLINITPVGEQTSISECIAVFCLLFQYYQSISLFSRLCLPKIVIVYVKNIS